MLKLNVVRQTVSKWERGLSVPGEKGFAMLNENIQALRK